MSDQFTPRFRVERDLPLRDKPRPESDEVGAVAARSDVQLLQARGDWALIRTAEARGWVPVDELGLVDTSNYVTNMTTMVPAVGVATRDEDEPIGTLAGVLVGASGAPHYPPPETRTEVDGWWSAEGVELSALADNKWFGPASLLEGNFRPLPVFKGDAILLMHHDRLTGCVLKGTTELTKSGVLARRTSKPSDFAVFSWRYRDIRTISVAYRRRRLGGTIPLFVGLQGFGAELTMAEMTSPQEGGFDRHQVEFAWMLAADVTAYQKRAGKLPPQTEVPPVSQWAEERLPGGFARTYSLPI